MGRWLARRQARAQRRACDVLDRAGTPAIHDAPVFGTVRSMDARGLERKFDIDAYVRRIERLRVTASTRTP